MAVATIQQQAGPQYPAIKPGMMGMYIFLASEVMFFGSLFATYFYLYGSHIVWPPPPPSSTPEFYVSWWPIPAINTVSLVADVLTCKIGGAAPGRGNGGGLFSPATGAAVWLFGRAE